MYISIHVHYVISFTQSLVIKKIFRYFILVLLVWGCDKNVKNDYYINVRKREMHDQRIENKTPQKATSLFVLPGGRHSIGVDDAASKCHNETYQCLPGP